MAKVDVKCPFVSRPNPLKNMVREKPGINAIAASYAAVLSSSTMPIVPVSPE
ncbi:hypothetical protein M977_04611 [Buttiauxella gaviniae ATCC 51604]|uniref:Uncharacterized protein n=1 Tax=Buttiauxella gaviniae ATCC 51604 TaxID=1354253 RepID=A0A1B7HLC2_9ENTR|nr:hypothetical protein M977_04611 [Buttiauxella gaviniae ATCC 51604]